MNLSKMSARNRTQIAALLDVVLDQAELQLVPAVLSIQVTFAALRRAGVSPDEIRALVPAINAAASSQLLEYRDVRDMNIGKEKGYFFFTVIDEQALRDMRSKLGGNAPTGDIRFNPETGEGEVGLSEFKLRIGTPEYKLFRACYERRGKRIEREEVATLIGLLPETKHSLVTIEISRTAHEIRAKTKLTPKQLVQNSGSVTLVE